MAQRRMFSPEIVESEEFLTMPLSSQALYFHLGMNADDDGFIQPKILMRAIGANDDDLRVLLGKRFLLPFEAGVVVIKHWLIHNMIRNDRYKATRFLEERKQLLVKENNAYTEKNKSGCQNGNQPAPQVRLGKVRLGKVSIGVCRFAPPTPEEVKQYCLERNNRVDYQRFIDFYESKGWMIGKNKMKDWRAAVRTWEKSEKKQILEIND